MDLLLIMDPYFDVIGARTVIVVSNHLADVIDRTSRSARLCQIMTAFRTTSYTIYGYFCYSDVFGL